MATADFCPKTPFLHADGERGFVFCGLWRCILEWWTRWGFDEKLERFVVANPFEDMIVAGVSFIQTGSQNRLLLGHGPKSIYEQLYQHVLKTI